MTIKFTNSQIDRLGTRLRSASLSDADLRLLDEYRFSFGPAYESVVRRIRDELLLEPTGRPAKSTASLIEKLRRETIRLSQVQDIAGCRVIAENIVEQEKIVQSLYVLFAKSHMMDRRENPSYGYRSVHVIVEMFGKLIEIQVRTLLQHVWAELSERLSDVVDPTIKYGGGDESIRKMLTGASEVVENYENAERKLARRQEQDTRDKHLPELEQQMVQLKHDIADHFREAISWLELNKGRNP